MFSLLLTLIMLSATIIFSGCSNGTESQPFDDFIRVNEDQEKIYLSEEQIKENIPEENFSQWIEDEKMRITIAATPCNELYPEWQSGGIYRIEAWFEWLEIPTHRGTDSIFVTMTQTTSLNNTFSVMRYQTVDGEIYEEMITPEFDIAEWNLPNKNITSLQIYEEIYVVMTRPTLHQYINGFAEYTHHIPISKQQTFSSLILVEYIPNTQE